MTPTEAVRFIERIITPLWPQARLTDETADAWYAAALKDLNWDDAVNAAKRLSLTTPFISLAELVTEVKRQREIRLAQRPLPAPAPELTENPPAYRDQIQTSIKQVADHLELDRRALPAPGHGAPPSAAYNQARGTYRDPIRLAALKVACPWQSCQADPGATCTTATGRPMPGRGHDVRLVAAGLADWIEINGVPRAVLKGADQS